MALLRPLFAAKAHDSSASSPSPGTGRGHFHSRIRKGSEAIRLSGISGVMMCSSAVLGKNESRKLVWIWTESKQVMTAAVERGWSTFIFHSEPRFKDLAREWSSIALIDPLFIQGDELFNEQNKSVAMLYDVSSPKELEVLQSSCEEAKDVVINFQAEWQVIPAENIVAAFQGCKRTVFAVSTTSTEAQVFLEALEQGLDGVVLKVEDMEEIFKLKLISSGLLGQKKRRE